MDENILEKPLNGDIPDVLWEAFEAARQQSGMKKKHAVAAAAYAFVVADRLTRLDWWAASQGDNFTAEADASSAAAESQPKTALGRKAQAKGGLGRGRKKGAAG